MYQGHRIAIVVPAFNEESHILDVIRGLPEFVDHVIVIDDASPDGTADRALSSNDSRLDLIRHSKNKGVGGAIVTGHKRAIELQADIAVVMAGDDQMDPQYLPDLLEPIVNGHADVAKGNRFYSRSSYSGMPSHRIIGNIALSFFTRAASGYWHVFDPQNGYVATSVSVLARLPLDDIIEGYAFENDMLIQLNIVGARVKDVAIPARYGAEISTLHPLHDGLRILKALFKGFFRRILWKYVLWSFSPVALLLGVGTLLTLFGIIVACWIFLIIGSTVPTAATVMLSVVPFMLGIQMMLFAMLLDIAEEPK